MNNSTINTSFKSRFGFLIPTDMLKYFCLFSLIGCIQFPIFSQPNPTVNPLKIHTLSPAPEVGTLGKYGETPVSTYTGVPNISLELYKINVKDLNFPLSISYHPVGQHVKEESSWVGLGWAFNCNGSISKNIRGLNDFVSGGYYNSNVIPDDPYPSDPLSYPNKYFFIQSNNFTNLKLRKDGVEKNYYDLLSMNYDFESDIYSINCFNLNAKFIFDKNNNIQLIDHSDIKIRYIVDLYKSMGDWEVTTPDGTRYYFGDRSDLYGPCSQYSGMAIDDKTHTHLFNTAETNLKVNTSVSSWFIRKIVSVQGEEILFQYEKPKKKINVGTQLIVPIPDVSQVKIDGWIFRSKVSH